MIRHRRTVLVTLAATAAVFSLGLAASTAAYAQGGLGGIAGGPGGPGGFGRMGRMMIDPTTNNETNLVDRDDVKRELLMSDVEAKQIQDMVDQQQQELMSKMRDTFTQMREKMQTNGQNPQQMDPAQRQTMMQNMRQLMQKQLGPMRQAQLKAIETILTGGQVTRLRQLDLQRRGPLALTDPNVASQVNLTQDQTTKMDALLKEYNTKLGESMRTIWTPSNAQGGNAQAGAQNGAGNGQGNGRPQFDPATIQAHIKEMQTEMDKLRKAEGDKAVALLTPAQKQKWTKLEGSIFTFAPDNFNFGQQ